MTTNSPQEEVLALAFALTQLCNICDEDASDGLLWAERVAAEVAKARRLLELIDARKYTRQEP